MHELGYSPRPLRAAIEDAVAWFRANGMLRS
jgi:dihydroflavonol-4-reductase